MLPPSVVLKLDHPPKQVIDCLGCVVMLLPGKGIGVARKNKNEKSLMTYGTTHFMRYPHWQPAYPDHEVWKRGVIYGEIYRMVQNTSPNAYDLLWKPLS